MATADSFAALGLYVRRAFLDPSTSERIRSEVVRAPKTEATVRTDDREYAVDRSTRSTDWASVASELVDLVTERLTASIPEVSEHYGVALNAVQPLQFLVYRPGDFFERHRDRGEIAASPFSRARRVAAIVFLNGAGDSTSGGHRGGELTLYGLFDQPGSDTLGLPLDAEEGLLVTFPADVVHEVRRVEEGERYTIVTWFE
jgi:predicted 2-oxoglutarate/Fe(II)-dependent dioxygenase YbiX